MNKYLQDSDFLKELSTAQLKEQYLRATILSWDEQPIKQIQGMLTGGTINSDGKSSMRNTLNLTMIISEEESNLTEVENLFSINKKAKIEIGLLNTTDKYPEEEVIWIPKGVYIFMNPSISSSPQGITLNATFQDKMATLNGAVGGQFPASVVLHELEAVGEDGKYYSKLVPIVQIIQEVVHHFGKEDLAKIIISDVPLRIRHIMSWGGSNPLYVREDVHEGIIQMTPSLDEDAFENPKIYSLGDDIGYTNTDFTFPGELVAAAGETVVSILDKIKAALGNYEYFYDVDGNFIFREIKNYLNTSQSTVELDKINNSDYIVDFAKGKSVFDFNEVNIVQSFNTTPQYSTIKNDFIVWGEKELADGSKLPIRYHLAIDSKPTVGNTYPTYFYKDEQDEDIEKAKTPVIYESKSEIPKKGIVGTFYFAKDENRVYNWVYKEQKYEVAQVEFQNIVTKDWRTELYLSGSSAEGLGLNSNDYYLELKNEWPKLYDVKNCGFREEALKSPGEEHYFLDFIDSDAALAKFSIQTIGKRSMVVSDDKVNCLFATDIPDIILLNIEDPELDELREEVVAAGNNYMQMSGNMFKTVRGGGVANSAFDKVRELLWQNTSYNESISITTLPIYHLEVNTIVHVQDRRSGINGDYLIQTISTPLAPGGAMTISATKIIERI